MSSERIDHAAEARELIENYAPDYMVAQVHATLALVEQQRIANLIALMQMQAECDEKTEHMSGEAMHALIEYVRTPATPFNGPDENPVFRPEIKEALGLS